MTKEDYYKTLGVSRDASEGDIKRAFKNLAKQCHPDLHPGDKKAEEQFKRVNEAYSILGDKERRRQYDQFGHAAFEQGGGGGGFDFRNFQGFDSIFEDFFGDIGGLFGQGRRGERRPVRGEDLAVELEVEFLDACLGKSREIQIERVDRCGMCGGSGEKDKDSTARCKQCNGHGKVQYSQGFFTISRACPICRGEGIVIENPCRECGGNGLTPKRKRIQVNIPPGVDTGTRLRLEREGNAGPRGADPGDLHVVIRVRDHEIFSREGDHILSELPISFPQAALGSTARVPTIHGEEEVEVKPGTQSGDTVTLRGRGVESLRRTGRGNHIVRFHVETPTNLTARQKELLQEFAEISGDGFQPMIDSFWRKVKKMFGKG